MLQLQIAKPVDYYHHKQIPINNQKMSMALENLVLLLQNSMDFQLYILEVRQSQEIDRQE
jgi:cysteinyl-tRNA synthetase